MASADITVQTSPWQWPRLRSFLGLALQLLLMIFIVAQFHLESTAFRYVFCFAAGGFAINFFLPPRLRLAFFAVLSLSAIVFVLGLTLAAWLIGLGLMLIGICHLPLSLKIRAALLLLVGGAFALMSRSFIVTPWSNAIWPILGSMFMFRLIVYLYDVRHGAPVSFWHAISYFFLLPNVCFPLFPVIDYKTFCRNRSAENDIQIYQTGASWIWRGIIQLIVYRYIYNFVIMDSLDVSNVAELAGYMISTFLLYIRISGQFHIIVGILHLFGFNLPESHRAYYLSCSFTDFWRRINIYWKDFMMKVIYYPVFFRLRKLRPSHALIVATLVTFLCTWFLHAYQWFWLRGEIFFEAHDIIFWSILAVLVIINALYELKYGRKRSLKPKQGKLSESIRLAAQTIGTFLLISVLWSFWSAESVLDWWWMCRDAMKMPEIGTEAVFYTLLAVAALALVVVAHWKGWTGRLRVPQRAAGWVTGVGALVLCVLSLAPVNSRLGHQGEVLASLQRPRLNRQDSRVMLRGYYEKVLTFGQFRGEISEVFGTGGGGPLGAGLAQETDDFRFIELRPNISVEFRGATVTTNRWGMRDKDYTLERPENTCRIALIGASHEMGTGVSDDETFESIVEERINRQLQAADSPCKFEFLNFAVGSFTPLHQLAILEERVLDFEPHAIIYAAHSVDEERLLEGWLKALNLGQSIPYPYLAELTREAKVDAHTGPSLATRRLRPHTNDALRWLYQRIARTCRERDIVPILLYVPAVTDADQPWRQEMHDGVMELAEEAGFLIWDLNDVYEGVSPDQLWISDHDPHANAVGNRMLADWVHRHMMQLLAEEWPPFVAAVSGERATE